MDLSGCRLHVRITARINIPIWATASVAFTFVAFAGYGVFAGFLPVAGVAALAATSLAVTG